ncbi:porin family protein [Pontibacter silvestris]|uniref:Porin family protein n=1 Tax=Pontibacter silvestris TaxID=2305183 RepID=A0ABW4WWC3_9BACT|nr:porin family protein [Pontibacter silvestris]MCC9136481.1 PorT family protein [Pontibacter silvestris]
MKKLFIVFSFIIATASVANAQSGLGIRVGANLSNVEGDLQNEDLFENKLGFHAGLTYNIPIVGEFFSVQPELLYSNKGYKNSDEEYTIPLINDTYRREGKTNMNYLDLPILAKIKAGPIYFEAGPQASYLLSVNNETELYRNDELQSSSTSQVDRDDMKKFEIGYAAGIGLATTTGFSIGVRYNGSFNDFGDFNPEDFEEGEIGSDLSNARNSVFMLTLGYNFGR